MTVIAAINTGALSKLTALNTNNYPDHHRAYVQTVRDYFRLEKVSSITADGITVIQPSTGPGRWIREMHPAPDWLLQPTWFIDPSAGIDENSGLDAGHPLKTFTEIARRFGSGTVINTSITIQWLGNGAATDYLTAKWVLGGTGILNLKGHITQLQGAQIFTSGTAILNPATPIPTVIKDTLVASFSSFVGKRVRITASTNPGSIGAIAWIQLAPSANTAYVTPFMLVGTDNITATTFPTPIAGDSYVIEDVSTVQVGHFSITNGSEEFNVNSPRYVVQDIRPVGNAAELGQFYIEDSIANFNNCYLDNVIFTSSGPGLELSGCICANIAGSGSGNIFVYGGGVRDGTISNIGYVFFIIDGDCYAEGFSLVDVSGGSTINLGHCCAFNSAKSGVMIRYPSRCDVTTPFVSSSAVYGNGHTRYGVEIEAGSSLAVHESFGASIPTITGTLGDVKIGQIVNSWADTPFIDTSSDASVVVIP